jgi:NADH:ubiquinone reductase (H+-translocating)
VTKPWKVVIIGGGFGGLSAAQSLKSPLVDVTLIDRRNYHLFQPLLYQVATGSLSPGEIAAPLRGVLSRRRNTRVLLGTVLDVDPESKRVFLADGAILDYDALIVAAGSQTSCCRVTDLLLPGHRPPTSGITSGKSGRQA